MKLNFLKIVELFDMMEATYQRTNILINIILNNIIEEYISKRYLPDVSIKDVVSAALKEYAFQPDEREKVNLNISQDFVFKGHNDLMVYIIFKLLKNALFYLSSSKEGKIKIWTETKETKNLLYFKDNGPGIDQRQMSNIFDSFMTSGKEGAGLGLPFCKRTLLNFGGNITCESELEKGTTFIIEFPILEESTVKHS